jgi:hypothetical protein
MTDLVQTPPLVERSQRPSALKVVMLDIAISVTYLNVSFCTLDMDTCKYPTWTPNLSLSTGEWIAPVAALRCQRIEQFVAFHLLLLLLLGDRRLGRGSGEQGTSECWLGSHDCADCEVFWVAATDAQVVF